MTGLCGWVNSDPSGDPRAEITQMADGLVSVADEARQEFHTDHMALAIRGWSGEVDLHSDGNIVAALVGVPNWKDPSLAISAERIGSAATLADLYEKSGSAALQKIGGAFSCAVFLLAERSGMVAIDRMGQFGLCYAPLPGGGLVFGTTADSVAAHPAVTSTITPQSLFNFLHFYVSPVPETIYREQRKLAAAESLVVDRSGFRTERWWSPRWFQPGEAQSDRDPKALASELRERMRVAVAASLAGSVSGEAGAFLSGGLDSTTLCGLLAAETTVPPKCFTIGFEDTDYDETPWAVSGAAKFGLDHRIHKLTPEEALSVFPKIATAYDEPFANSSAIPTWFCADMARQAGVSVMIAGDGGDELFAGNERYVEQGVYDPWNRIPESLRRSVLSPLVRTIGAAVNISLFRRAAHYVKQAETDLPARLYAKHPLHSYFGQVFSKDALDEIDPRHAIDLLQPAFDAVGHTDRLQQMMRLDWQITLADNDLRKVGRMCAMAGCRVRFPFLDDGLVEFAASLPPDLLLMDGRLRGFYKSAMQGFLPDDILNKPKHGFGMPFEKWLQTHPPFRNLACDSLAALGKRRVFHEETLQGLADDISRGRENPLSGIAWDLVSLELWWQTRPMAGLA